MKRVSLLLAILCLTSTASAAIPSAEMLELNYGRGGSCAYASATVMLRVNGYPRSAAVLRKHYRYGVTLQRLAREIHHRGFNVRGNFRGDVKFLERYDSAVIDFGDGHAVFFCGFYNGGTLAVISDPNRKRLEVYDKAAFVRYWQRYGGRAVAIKTGV